MINILRVLIFQMCIFSLFSVSSQAVELSYTASQQAETDAEVQAYALSEFKKSCDDKVSEDSIEYIIPIQDGSRNIYYVSFSSDEYISIQTLDLGKILQLSVFKMGCLPKEPRKVVCSLASRNSKLDPKLAEIILPMDRFTETFETAEYIVEMSSGTEGGDIKTDLTFSLLVKDKKNGETLLSTRNQSMSFVPAGEPLISPISLSPNSEAASKPELQIYCYVEHL